MITHDPALDDFTVQVDDNDIHGTPAYDGYLSKMHTALVPGDYEATVEDTGVTLLVHVTADSAHAVRELRR